MPGQNKRKRKEDKSTSSDDDDDTDNNQGTPNQGQPNGTPPAANPAVGPSPSAKGENKGFSQADVDAAVKKAVEAEAAKRGELESQFNTLKTAYEADKDFVASLRKEREDAAAAAKAKADEEAAKQKAAEQKKLADDKQAHADKTSSLEEQLAAEKAAREALEQKLKDNEANQVSAMEALLNKRELAKHIKAEQAKVPESLRGFITGDTIEEVDAAVKRINGIAQEFKTQGQDEAIETLRRDIGPHIPVPQGMGSASNAANSLSAVNPHDIANLSKEQYEALRARIPKPNTPKRA